MPTILTARPDAYLEAEYSTFSLPLFFFISLLGLEKLFPQQVSLS